MATLIQKWEESGIAARMAQYKPVFKEPKTKAEFQSVMSEYYANIDDPRGNGAIFMAVCRGKVSEGLDFADMNGRAVVITGLPYPPRMDPRVVLKMDFLTSMRNKWEIKGLGGEDWYKQQAFRAVNQAIGRVIRHKSDWGAIILCDQRFGSSNVKAQLPLWVRPYAVSHESFGVGLKSLVSFFKEAKSAWPRPEVNKKTMGKVKDENANTCQSGNGNAGSCKASAMDAFFYKPRVAQTKSNSVEYHAPSLDSRRHHTADDFVSELQSQSPTMPPTRKRPLKVEYEEESDSTKKPSLSSALHALESAPTSSNHWSRRTSERPESVKTEADVATEAAVSHRMANQARKKIKISSGTKDSLISQVLKKSVAVSKPLKTSTPKRSDSGDPDENSRSKELSSIHSDSVGFDGVVVKTENDIVVKKETDAVEPKVPPLRDKTSPANVAKPAPSLKSKEKAAAYLAKVKKCLAERSDFYKGFTAALKRYQKDNDYGELTRVLVQVFLDRSEWHPLLRGFFHFVRPDHKSDFEQLCLDLTGRKCGAD